MIYYDQIAFVFLPRSVCLLASLSWCVGRWDAACSRQGDVLEAGGLKNQNSEKRSSFLQGSLQCLKSIAEVLWTESSWSAAHVATHQVWGQWIGRDVGRGSPACQDTAQFVLFSSTSSLFGAPGRFALITTRLDKIIGHCRRMSPAVAFLPRARKLCSCKCQPRCIRTILVCQRKCGPLKRMSTDVPEVCRKQYSFTLEQHWQLDLRANSLSAVGSMGATLGSLSRIRCSFCTNPKAEVGMAVQKGTVQRAKASGIGSLSNSQGVISDGRNMIRNSFWSGCRRCPSHKSMRTLLWYLSVTGPLLEFFFMPRHGNLGQRPLSGSQSTAVPGGCCACPMAKVLANRLQCPDLNGERLPSNSSYYCNRQEMSRMSRCFTSYKYIRVAVFLDSKWFEWYVFCCRLGPRPSCKTWKRRLWRAPKAKAPKEQPRQ